MILNAEKYILFAFESQGMQVVGDDLLHLTRCGRAKKLRMFAFGVGFDYYLVT
jgi:hypothetical protein